MIVARFSKTKLRTSLHVRLAVFQVYLVTVFSPIAAHAQTEITLVDPPKDATELLNRISIFIIDPIIFTLFTAAFVVFVWGLVQFVAHLDNEEARSTGSKHMIWGIIGMVVMVGVNSIIAIIQSTIAQIGG